MPADDKNKFCSALKTWKWPQALLLSLHVSISYTVKYEKKCSFAHFENPTFPFSKISETIISNHRNSTSCCFINDSAVVRLAPFSYGAWRHDSRVTRPNQPVVSFSRDKSQGWGKQTKKHSFAIHSVHNVRQRQTDKNTSVGHFAIFSQKILSDESSERNRSKFSCKPAKRACDDIKSEITISVDKTRKSSDISLHLFFVNHLKKNAGRNGNVLHGWM